MIPKIFKILRKGKSQVSCIYIRYDNFCGKLRPVYIGQTDNIFSKRPERKNDSSAGDYEELRRMESVSNKKRREEYEASLIIKLELSSFTPLLRILKLLFALLNSWAL